MPTITEYNLGTPLNTDVLIGVDTTDTSMAPTGTTKKYNQSDITNFYLRMLGLTVFISVRAATTANLTAVYDNGTSGVGATLTNNGVQAALVLDGAVLQVGDRVIVKNQSSALENGIYVVTDIGSASTNWILTRAPDYNQTTEMVIYGVVLVIEGSTQANTIYMQMNAVALIGGSPINYGVYALNDVTVPPVSTANQYLLSIANGKPIWSGSLGNALANQISFVNNATGGIVATATNDSAAAGFVGEVISSVIPGASSIGLTTAVTANITSIVLSAGDWDVWGNFAITFSSLGLSAAGWGSTTSATIPDISLMSYNGVSPAAITNYRAAIPGFRLLLSAPTTVYLSTNAVFAAGTATACGGIYARRRR